MDWLENINKALENKFVKQSEDVEDLNQLASDCELEKYWMKNSDFENVYHVSYIFQNEYKKNNELIIYKDKLKEVIKQYEKLIYCIGNLTAAYHIKHNNVVDSNEKEKYYSKATFTQLHIDRLKYQCSQLIYRKQKEDFEDLNDNRKKDAEQSFSIAIMALIISAIFSIASLVITIIYGESCTVQKFPFCLLMVIIVTIVVIVFFKRKPIIKLIHSFLKK